MRNLVAGAFAAALALAGAACAPEEAGQPRSAATAGPAAVATAPPPAATPEPAVTATPAAQAAASPASSPAPTATPTPEPTSTPTPEPTPTPTPEPTPAPAPSGSGLRVSDEECGGSPPSVSLPDSVTRQLAPSGQAVGTTYTGPYTGKTFVVALRSNGVLALRDMGVDRDHVVAKQDAWVSGGCGWAPARWKAFVRDPANLLVVDASENRSKSDDGPADWTPPVAAFGCAYVGIYVSTKERYDLVVSTRDEAAIVGSGCLD